MNEGVESSCVVGGADDQSEDEIIIEVERNLK